MYPIFFAFKDLEDPLKIAVNPLKNGQDFKMFAYYLQISPSLMNKIHPHNYSPDGRAMGQKTAPI